MNKLEFNFDEDSFNKLFPFYILIDSNLKIKSFGKSLAKTLPGIKLNDTFSSTFEVKRPFVENPDFDSLTAIFDQLIVISTTSNAIDLRGQFQQFNDSILFVGSPWFVSMNQVRERKLTLHDFAFHDPLLDLLHVLKTQEITTQELKELLFKINNQKKDLKRDQEELNRLSLVARANENGVVFTKPDGVIFWCNDAYLKLTGFSIEEVIGATPVELGKCEYTNKEDLKKMIVPFLNGEMFDVELVHGRKDGSYFWTKTKGQPVLDSTGNVVQYFAMIEDITEKKNADFKLIESEDRLSFLIRNLQTGIILEDENKRLLLVNKKLCSMFDFEVEPDALIGSDFSGSVEDSKRFFKNPDIYAERLNNIFKENKAVYNEELELIDGRFFERSYVPIFRDGIYKGNLRSYVDITIKKKHEEILQNEKEKYSNIIANMNLGLIEVDQNDRITLVNHSFCEISGYTVSELIGKKASNLFLNEENIQLIETKNKLRVQGVTDSYEVQIKNKKGEKRYWLISGAPNYDVNGKIMGSIGVHLDITEQKEQEEKLYLLSLIAEKNLNSVVISDKEGRIEWVNSSFEKMSGYTKEELIGMKPGYLLQGATTNPETINYLKNQISKGQPFNCEILNYSKSGEKYWVKIQGQALYNTRGEIVRYFAIEENVTNKKLLENQREELVVSLAKTNKELEDYAQIVSHDLKSPLRSIHSLISWIKSDNDKEFSDLTLSYFSMIENKVEKMDYLIDGILTYSKIDKEELPQESINTHQIIQSIINIIYIPEHISITIKNQLPMLQADRYRIQQLFQNIIGNAVNYIEEEVGLVEVASEEFEDYYVFSIKDNGVGIAKEHHQKIFNTFQSYTKSEHSTGLGLAIVKKIIDAYNGKIWVDSELGKGSTFFIKLNK
ncbi:PAS domain S-box protein [Flavobacterium sp. F-328]|uniref:PAS domain S-box protein n=1 Tax=Flavobacterium erciyesense TaxID=2825842 RepID=A0ABS5D547_9FLAO|nr:PAS domain S-box protein [Flavobacterium erciyesense]MBQ0909161.1 PAS domain S-box protein [Flavobacterium erciyesense]